MGTHAGKDIYNGPGNEFGLLDNTNTSYNAGINVMPSKQVSFGANYGLRKVQLAAEFANANPPGTDYGSWTDPNRIWNLNNDEQVNNFDLYLDLNRLLTNTIIKFNYDYSDSDNAFVHSGPRITELSTNTPLTAGDTRPCATGLTSCFLPLPNVTNKWQRAGVDLKYFFTAKVGVGLGYWFEKFDVTDFATIDLPGEPGTPRIDTLGEIGTATAAVRSRARPASFVCSISFEQPGWGLRASGSTGGVRRPDLESRNHGVTRKVLRSRHSPTFASRSSSAALIGQ